MSSGVGMGLITRQIAKMYKFNNYQYSVVIGLLLSDAWIIYNKRSVNPRIGFKQKTKNKKQTKKNLLQNLNIFFQFLPYYHLFVIVYLL